MKRWDDFLSETPRPEFEKALFAAVDKELTGAPQPFFRRAFLRWMAPAALGVAGVVTFELWRKEKPEPSQELAFMAELEEEVGGDIEENFALLEDIDLMDDLEVLEKWTTNS